MTVTYDVARYQKVMTAMEQVSSFAGIAAWDRAAQAEVDEIERTINALDVETAKVQQQLTAAQAEYDNKNFLAKLFSSRKQINEATVHLSNIATLKGKYDQMAEHIQSQIDFTPNDSDEQKALLKVLKLRKKELLQEKREIASTARQIRVQARQASANIGPNYGSRFVGQLNANERRSIRLQKEAALAPNENAKTAIERQLLVIERRTLWAERFND